MTHIAFRCDATADMGSGHLMRCLALALALKDRGAMVRFLCRALPAHLHRPFREHGLELHELPVPCDPIASDPPPLTAHHGWLPVPQSRDAADALAALQGIGPVDWLVVDHYALDARWERALRPAAKHILAIDDLADRDHDCDMLLDQNFRRDTGNRYSGRLVSGTTVLLGPRYALLRDEFAQARRRLRTRDGRLERILVFFGGFDTRNDTMRALAAIAAAGLREVAVDVVIGSSHGQRRAIEDYCRARPLHTLHVDTSGMAKLMSQADLAIGAGGATQYERCCLGLPTMVLSVADNQHAIAQDLGDEGACAYLGRADEVTDEQLVAALRGLAAMPSVRAAMGRRASALADGEGARRVAARLAPEEVTLRRATMEDCERLFEWRNAEENRQFAHDSALIAHARHRDWFTRNVSAPGTALLIGEQHGEAVGVLRYDLQQDSATVSVYLVPGFHGRGLGTPLLLAGTSWIRSHAPSVRRLVAEIRRDNVASLQAFRHAGFKEQTRVLTLALNHVAH